MNQTNSSLSSPRPEIRPGYQACPLYRDKVYVIGGPCCNQRLLRPASRPRWQEPSGLTSGM